MTGEVAADRVTRRIFGLPDPAVEEEIVTVEEEIVTYFTGGVRVDQVIRIELLGATMRERRSFIAVGTPDGVRWKETSRETIEVRRVGP